MENLKRTLSDIEFKRMFSVNLYKNLKFKLGEMSFYKDWTDTDRGDPYPSCKCSENSLTETMGRGIYAAENKDNPEPQKIKRMLGQFFPFASYELKITSLTGKAGFSFECKNKDFKVKTELHIQNNSGKVTAGFNLKSQTEEKTETKDTELDFKNDVSFIVTCRAKAFDLYLSDGVKPEFLCTFNAPQFAEINNFDNFSVSSAYIYTELCAGECFSTSSVSWYLDSGVSQADIKPLKYEDGTPLITDGRIFMSMTSRYEAESYQSIISFNPSGCDFKLEGAVFYDTGDRLWNGDIAASMVYDRNSSQWLVWMCSFSHGHVLACGTSKADLRYGINVVDVTLMNPKSPTDDDTVFLAKEGDEDPDLIYDEKSQKWYMAICRVITENNKRAYRYFFYESDNPFTGYKFINKTPCGDTTGGSFVRFEDGIYFVCGSSFNEKARYDVYDMNNFSAPKRLRCDYDDGGFRGWGTIMQHPCGNRTRYLWMTFDRHRASDAYNWSYGNLYVYSAF